MEITTERFVVNEAGDRVAVLIDMTDYLKLLDAVEELESIRAYDAAKSDPSVEAIPFEQAVREIENVVGSYRVIYEIDDPARSVTIMHVGHRRDIYR